MAYIVNNKRIKQVSVLTEPNSYQTDIQPEDMQSGRTAVSKGKIVTGTGRAFEFAAYGWCTVDLVLDENGVKRYGIMIKQKPGCNLMLVSSTPDGDIVAQKEFVIAEMQEGSVVRIGSNMTTSSDLYAFYNQGYICIYSVDSRSIDTILNYFVGKDSFI